MVPTTAEQSASKGTAAIQHINQPHTVNIRHINSVKMSYSEYSERNQLHTREQHSNNKEGHHPHEPTLTQGQNRRARTY